MGEKNELSILPERARRISFVNAGALSGFTSDNFTRPRNISAKRVFHGSMSSRKGNPKLLASLLAQVLVAAASARSS